MEKIYKQTMNKQYKDSSNHLCCPNCGLCITCGDCKCELRKEWKKRGLINEK